MSSIRTDLRLGVRIGIATVRDRFRRHTNSRRQNALFVLLGLFTLPWLVFFVQQAYVLGTVTRSGVDAPVLAIARNLLVPTMLAFVAIAGLETVQQLGSEAVRPLLLTTAPVRAIVVGKVLSLLVSWLLLVGMGFVLVLAYAAGAHTPLFPVAALLVTIPVFVLILLVGLGGGYLLWLGVERLGFADGTRQLLTATVYLGVMAGLFAVGSVLGEGVAEEGLAGLLPTGDPILPLGWYADLFFLGSPIAPDVGPSTILSFVFVLVVIPVAFVGVCRLAPRYWYATPAESTERVDSPNSTERVACPSETIGRTPGWVSGSPTVRVALGYLRRARRQPSQFVYLFYYLFPVTPILVQQALGTAEAFALTLGAALVLLGVWLAGGIFCLNPLGDEGTMLSQIVLANRPAETFVHARLLLGSALGLVVTVTGTILVNATLEQITPLLAVLGGVFVGLTVIASGALALGLGSVLPKFEAVEIFESVETVAPSLIAGLLHAGLSVLLLLGALGVAFVTGTATTLSVQQTIAAVGAFALILWVITDGSRRYAIARLREYGYQTVRTDRPFTIYVSIGMAVLALLLGQATTLAAVFLVGANVSIERLLPILFVIEYLGYGIVAVGFLYVTHRGIAYLDLSWPSGREIALVVGGSVASLALWGVASLVVTGLGLPAADHTLFESGDASSPTLLLALVPLVLLVNGPIEELLYRNAIQKYLTERFSQTAAVSIASAIFALSHVPAYLTAGFGALSVTLTLLFVVSCFWGTIYARTKSLFVAAAIHGLYNASLVFGLYLTL